MVTTGKNYQVILRKLNYISSDVDQEANDWVSEVHSKKRIYDPINNAIYIITHHICNIK